MPLSGSIAETHCVAFFIIPKYRRYLFFRKQFILKEYSCLHNPKISKIPLSSSSLSISFLKNWYETCICRGIEQLSQDKWHTPLWGIRYLNWLCKLVTMVSFTWMGRKPYGMSVFLGGQAMDKWPGPPPPIFHHQRSRQPSSWRRLPAKCGRQQNENLTWEDCLGSI